MGRGLLSATVRPRGGDAIAVGAVHLESLAAAPQRREQLQIACAALEHARNFTEPRGTEALENATVTDVLRPLGWADATASSGKTFDTAANAMLRGHAEERMRYDR
eukprot:gene44479-47477_t